MADIFLSYKRDDTLIAKWLIKKLTDRGFTVWWDDEIELNEQWLERIVEEIKIAPCFIGLWTTNALNEDGLFIPAANGRNYLQLEHSKARPENLIGVQIHRGVLWAEGATNQAVDLSDCNRDDENYDPSDHPGFKLLVEKATELATPLFLNPKMRDLRHDVEKVEDLLKKARQNRDVFERQCGELRAELATVKEDHAANERAWKMKKASFEQKISDLQDHIEADQARIASAEGTADRLMKKNQSSEERIHQLIGTQEEEMQSRKRAEAKLLDQVHKAEVTESELRKMAKEMKRLRQRLKELEATPLPNVGDLSPMLRQSVYGFAGFGVFSLVGSLSLAIWLLLYT